jgi:probable rRNA maturation factor
MIELFFEDVEIPDLDPDFFVSWLSAVCVDEGSVLGEVSVIFCSDDYLLKMNQEHLDHDYYTDIITFDYTENKVVSGDLFISKDRVFENAIYHKVAFASELNRVVVHGVLHLIGFKDKSEVDARLMRAKEDLYLQKIVSRET